MGADNFRWTVASTHPSVPHPSETLGAGVIAAAVEYVKLRDSLNAHSSPEGKKLNASVKAYLQAVQSR